MALGKIVSTVARRNFSTSVARCGGGGGIRGSSLPFQTENKWRLVLVATLFFGSGFSAPFFLLRHQLLKK